MNFVVVIAALASMASAGVVIIPSGSTLLRRPILDSAVVQSERLGGNFAYAIAEGQSFQRVAPIITRNTLRTVAPLGVSYALNAVPIWSGLNAPLIRIDQDLGVRIRDEEQKQWDREIELHDQLVQAQRQLQQNAADAVREQIELQIEQQQSIIQQQQEINDQAALAVQQVQATQEAQIAQIVPVAPPAVATTVDDDSVVVESAEPRSDITEAKDATVTV